MFTYIYDMCWFCNGPVIQWILLNWWLLWRCTCSPTIQRCFDMDDHASIVPNYASLYFCRNALHVYTFTKKVLMLNFPLIFTLALSLSDVPWSVPYSTQPSTHIAAQIHGIQLPLGYTILFCPAADPMLCICFTSARVLVLQSCNILTSHVTLWVSRNVVLYFVAPFLKTVHILTWDDIAPAKLKIMEFKDDVFFL